MMDLFVDTDVIIRFITGDNPRKQAAADALFRQVSPARGRCGRRPPLSVTRCLC